MTRAERPRRPVATHPEPKPWERALIAGVLAVLGALTGIIALWLITDVPGIDVGVGVYLAVASVAGALCFVCALRSSDATVDSLGRVWQVVWRLSRGVLKVVRALYRS